MLEHREQEALAKTARAQKSELVSSFFYSWDEVSTINVKVIPRYDGLKIGDAVGELRVGCHVLIQSKSNRPASVFKRERRKNCARLQAL